MYEYKLKLWLERRGRYVFGEGAARLLRALESTGSLKKAAKRAGFSYTYAWRLLRRVSECAGTTLVATRKGGFRGGATVLTAEGKKMLAQYEQKKKDLARALRYPAPLLTVDGIVWYRGKLVLVQRKREPFKGFFALPGGFVRRGETLENAVVREVKEETGLSAAVKELVGAYSAPGRDPRGHVVSVVYELEAATGEPRAASDAREVALFAPSELPKTRLAFDHNEILNHYFRRAERKR